MVVPAVAADRGPSGGSRSGSSSSSSSTNRGPSGGISSSRTTTTTRVYSPATHTYVVRSGYFYSGWGGYYGCLWCFSGPYAYGPVNLAGYSAPAPVDFFVLLFFILLVVIFFWWLRRRTSRTDTYIEREEHHVNWP